MKFLASVFFAFLFIISCTTKKQNIDKIQNKSKIVNLAIWANYLSSESIAEFKKKSGIDIHLSHYSSNEELLAKVQSGNSGYDVIVPSDYMVDILIKSQLLHPFNKSKIYNISNIDTSFLQQDYDNQNTYSLPYSWSTAGIAVNTQLFKGEIKGWSDVFNNSLLDGKISLLDDVREVMAIALKLNGKSINTKEINEIEMAKNVLKKIRNKIKMFRSDTIDILTQGDVMIAHSYSTDSLQAMHKTKGVIKYIIPTEGATRSIDNLVILKESKNLEESHLLIDFLLSQSVNLKFVQTIFGGPVLKNTKSQLPKDLQNLESLFPSNEILSKLEKILDLGETTKVYDKAWTEIKSD